MIEYVHPSSLDSRIIRRAVDCLQSGSLVAVPTDTTWSLCCSSESKAGVERLQGLKASRNFTPSIMCSRLSQWEEFTHLDTTQFRLVKKKVPGPYVFIFKAFSSFEKRFGIKRPFVGLRIPDHPVPQALVEALGHPLFSGTASRNMSDTGWWDAGFAEANLYDCGYELEEIPGVELVLDHGDSLPRQLSTVVDLSGDDALLVRQGIGDWP